MAHTGLIPHICVVINIGFPIDRSIASPWINMRIKCRKNAWQTLVTLWVFSGQISIRSREMFDWLYRRNVSIHISWFLGVNGDKYAGRLIVNICFSSWKKFALPLFLSFFLSLRPHLPLLISISFLLPLYLFLGQAAVDAASNDCRTLVSPVRQFAQLHFGKYICRLFIPRISHGPFFCFIASTLLFISTHRLWRLIVSVCKLAINAALRGWNLPVLPPFPL